MAGEDAQLEAARAARRKALRLLELAPVCGVGIARENDRYVVKLSLEREPDPSLELPEQIDGVPVVVEMIGPVRAQSSD